MLTIPSHSRESVAFAECGVGLGMIEGLPIPAMCLEDIFRAGAHLLEEFGA